jgi:cellulose synthase/poly-beta-1,6-N-acetylglucosamine synthase-like glycosyltransferase
MSNKKTTYVELTIVVPTYNEGTNVPLLVDQLRNVLEGIDWEVIFVDDDSPDGTAQIVRAIGSTDGRVRCIRRIGNTKSRPCMDKLEDFAGRAPESRRIEITVSRRYLGIEGAPVDFTIVPVAPELRHPH